MIIFLTGDNAYAIKTETDRLKDEFVKAHGEAGIEQYAAKEVELNRLPDLISGGSLFSPNRFVIIRDVGENKELAESIAEHAVEVDDSTALVLSQAQPDKRTRWYKILQKHAKNFNHLTGGALIGWLIQEAERRGGKLKNADARHLITLAGEDQWRLSNELDKLLSSGSVINRRSIEELVEPSGDETIFQLIDMVVNGRVRPALKLYDRLRLGEIEPHQFVGTLAWQLNALAVVKADSRASSAQLASTSGLSPFVVDRLKPLAKRVSLRQLRQAMRRVIEADYDMKQTGSEPDQRAKLLISQLGQVIS